MISKIFKLFVFFILFYNCSPIKQVDKQLITKNSILYINEYNSCYFITTQNISSLDTIYVVSLKENIFNKYNIQKPLKKNEFEKEIKLNDTVSFNLIEQPLTPAGTMEVLGLYLIIENDTLWRGPKFIPRKFYQSKNSIGLRIE